MKRFALAAVILASLAAPAAAHVRYAVRHTHHHGPVHRKGRPHHARRSPRVHVDPIVPAAAARSTPLVAEAMRFLGARHSPTGFRGEWCGDFMGFVARREGYRVPSSFRLARSWARAGRRVGAPVLGSVMAMSHHVGLVLAAAPGRVLLLSGNHSHRVAIGWYQTSRALAFVELERA